MYCRHVEALSSIRCLLGVSSPPSVFTVTGYANVSIRVEFNSFEHSIPPVGFVWPGIMHMRGESVSRDAELQALLSRTTKSRVGLRLRNSS
jgi:hypothetical protein